MHFVSPGWTQVERVARVFLGTKRESMVVGTHFTPAQ